MKKVSVLPVAEPWNRVGSAIDERRRELLMSPQKLADESGVSLAAVKNLMRSLKSGYREETLWSVCRALQWSPDSIQRILDGGEPVLLDAPDRRVAAASGAAVPIAEFDDELQRRIEQAVRKAFDERAR